MALDMPYEDIHRDVVNCLLMYKNKPVFVQNCTREGKIKYLDILSQRTGQAQFSLKTFLPPALRLGMVNIGGGVLYLSRVPVRKYFLGLSYKNIKIETVDAPFPEGGPAAMTRIKGLACPELGDALFNRYPTFEDALSQVNEYGGACAFDKQFAIDYRGYVWYKTQRIGISRGKTIAEIEFSEGYKHLGILLENNHEKTIRNIEEGSTKG